VKFARRTCHSTSSHLGKTASGLAGRNGTGKEISVQLSTTSGSGREVDRVVVAVGVAEVDCT
jgi:hypothetical protein